MFKATYNFETKVWSGPKVPPIYNPNQNLGQLILKVLEMTPNAVSQVSADTDVSVTCREMRNRILKIAAYLNTLELQQGDVIGIFAANTENLAPTVFACFLMGLPVNSLSPIMTESDIVQMYSKTKPKLIFCDGNNLKVVQNAVNTMKSEAKIYTIMESVAGIKCVSEIMSNSKLCSDFIIPAVDPSSTVFIICSSGSTGSPKGTRKSHQEIITHMVPSDEYSGDDRVFFQYSPLFWFSGIYYLVLSTLYKATRIITAKPSTPQYLVDIINKHKVTNIFTAPFAVVSLLQLENFQPFESVRNWILSGATLSETLCSKFEKYLPNGIINSCYGCSEFNFITNDLRGEKFGSCGSAFENVDLKIIDDDGNALDNNQQGEIAARKALPFLGYFDDEEKTKEAYDGEWFKTGDIGYFDDDGNIYVIDRKKELLKFNNYQVTPSELEAIINKIEGVVSSCVVGILEKNTGNDIIHAFVIIKEGSGLTEDFIVKYIDERVIDAKRLRGGVHFLETFPLGHSGKVAKKSLKKLAEEKFTKCF